MTVFGAAALPPEVGAQAWPELMDWDAFVSASTAQGRCHTWLALVCAKIAGLQAAAVLIESPLDHSFVPMAVWPKAGPDLGRLAAVVDTALREGRSVVKPLAELPGQTHMAYPLVVDKRVAAVVALELQCSHSEVAGVLREIHWSSAWLVNLLSGRELAQAIQGRERVGSVLETTATALRHGKLRQAMFEVANTLRQRFVCSRVAIGLVSSATVRLFTLSEAAVFEKHALLVKAYERAMDEAYDEGAAIGASDTVNPANTAARSWPQHAALRAISGAGAVLSFPLMLGGQAIAVITLERDAQAFIDEDLLWLEAFGALVAPIMQQRLAAERGALGRLGHDARQVLHQLFGPRHLTWKLGTASVLLMYAVLVWVPVAHRVSAKTVVEGEIQRVVAAPFEGFVGAAYVRAGDTVQAGQLLVQLDDRALRVEQAKWASDHDQFDSRLREAMANHDLTAMQVVGAQVRQSSAQLALVSDKIALARLSAPFDGVVVSGDLSQQIGAPVELGKKLFEIAPLQRYRIILQVDEREIRHVQVGQTGRLVMTGIAGEPMDFTVAKVTPVATAQDGKNFFRVEATLAQASLRLRPGMEGIGKLEVGEQSLWWVLTHSLIDWWTLSVWTWMP